ncbi:hypothetical protein [Flavobacterium sp.]|uniref:hypothetical protein n=1 Tax=Flavobacterium sp. TaxID=239 RepID=UPI00374D2A78
MNKPKKITIKHYLEKRCIKPKLINNIPHWEVYISITVNRKTTNLKSSIFELFNTIDDLHKKESKVIENEVKELETKIRLELNKDNNYSFTQPRRRIAINEFKTIIKLEKEILELKRKCKNQQSKIYKLEQLKLKLE